MTGMSRTSATDAITIERWPTERSLLALAAIVSALLWIVAIVSVVGLVYAAFAGALFFVMHLAFVAHVRGSGVRLGPEQFPELHDSVERLAQRIGLARAPETYILQAGGALNALATRFLRTHIVVLYSDLLDACGSNTAARDMIVAHELGHIRAGHLRWRWFLLPSLLVPLLGAALSRAREYTCDRYGLAGAGDRDGALLGLCILAAGARHGASVNHQALARQRGDLNTGWMTLGEWLSSHPPLAKRVAALDPTLATGSPEAWRGALRAAAIVAMVLSPLLLLGWAAATRLPAFLERARAQTAAGAEHGAEADRLPAAVALQRARRDLRMFATFLEDERSAGRALPADTRELYARWTAAHPDEEEPLDPFDGEPYGYERKEGAYIIWSSGADQEPNTDDDLVFDSRSPADTTITRATHRAAARATAPTGSESTARRGRS